LTIAEGDAGVTLAVKVLTTETKASEGRISGSMESAEENAYGTFFARPRGNILRY